MICSSSHIEGAFLSARESSMVISQSSHVCTGQTLVVHYVQRARKVGWGGVQLIRWEGGGWAADNSMAISQAGSVQLIDPPNCIPHCLTVSLPHILSCTSPIPSSWHHNSDSPIFQYLSAIIYGYSQCLQFDWVSCILTTSDQWLPPKAKNTSATNQMIYRWCSQLHTLILGRIIVPTRSLQWDLGTSEKHQSVKFGVSLPPLPLFTKLALLYPFAILNSQQYFLPAPS